MFTSFQQHERCVFLRKLMMLINIIIMKSLQATEDYFSELSFYPNKFQLIPLYFTCAAKILTNSCVLIKYRGKCSFQVSTKLHRHFVMHRITQIEGMHLRKTPIEGVSRTRCVQFKYNFRFHSIVVLNLENTTFSCVNCLGDRFKCNPARKQKYTYKFVSVLESGKHKLNLCFP